MRVHARAASIAIAGAALLAASAVTAAPAVAAPTVLTQATCEAGGGTFTFVRPLKTCTTLTVVPVDEIGRYGTSDGAFSAYYDVHYVGTDTFQTKQTQKGKGPIKAATTYLTGSGTNTIVTDSRECFESVPGSGDEPRDVSVCVELGMYVV